MNLLSIVGDVISPVTKLIDNLHTSDEERLKAKESLAKIQLDMSLKVLDAQTKLVEQQAKIITAEAQGESWLQRTWRPITMLFFLVCLGVYWFGLAPQYLIDNPDVVEKLFTIIGIGIGGYIGSRGIEKSIDKWKKNEN
jgi:hypothetical protein